ncbi:NADH-dependent flavin oxidoreductase [Liberiplasma polymorphum]|uniref:NADH-dependent flavin oxidoreductase n=1 Tax=Liberiplasma polymorphum TaxID=3374570 RepID=UPI00377367AB
MNPFKPYELKQGITLRNRLVMAPMTTYSSQLDLTVSDEELNYYYLRSQSLGMVITAATSVNEQAQAFPLQITLKNDSYIPSMKRLAKAIKDGGAKAVVQIHHGGRMNDPKLYEDHENIVSASNVKAERDPYITPRTMTKEEIYQTIEDFAQAAKRALLAGFDGVELHGANTYLLQQFFSPHSNRRNDEFGGTLTNRMKFIELLIKRTHEIMRMTTNEPFILGYRFSPEELEEPGITIDDTKKLVQKFKTLPLDYLHISLRKYNQTSNKDAEDNVKIIDHIQEALNHEIPFIGVGQIETKEAVEDAIKSGYDLVAAGMILLSDPNWPLTIEQGLTPSKLLSKNTLPTPLFERLKRNEAAFAPRGYTFES